MYVKYTVSLINIITGISRNVVVENKNILQCCTGAKLFYNIKKRKQEK